MVENKPKTEQWKAVLEEPSQEEGSVAILVDLPLGSTERDVKDYLLTLTLEDKKTKRFHEQDLNPPYLHFIKRVYKLD